ncbi:uncharacterized protein LOC135194276 [Vanessa tameamea]|uniref:Uncharacterized protein LOC135194276 n=1 Tax=Vanessa tameamea TaxID=334116 RepID=A0ABM4AWI6_VANTA
MHRSKGFGDLNEYIDIQALEFDIRRGNINYESCESVSWCVQSNILYSDRLLQTAIMFYDKFIELKRKEVIIHSILQANKEVRYATVMFLISETCRAASQQQYMQLWRDLFDSNDKTDNLVMEYAPYIVDDVMEYFLGVMEGLGGEEIPPRVTSQLSVLVLVLRSHPRAHARLARALCAASRTCARAVCAAIVCAVCSGFCYENISIEQCPEDDEKLQCSLALIEVLDNSPYCDTELIIALEMIFTSNVVAASTLSRALVVLEEVLQRKGSGDTRVIEIIRRVEKRSRRIDRRMKDGRVLYRDVVMFLGKYGVTNDDTTNLDNYLIARLKNKILLELPYDDTTFKINLQGVLQAALEQEDVDACKTLRAVICANS